jgi:hypothetical protein
MYFRQHDNDIPKALRYYERAVNLAKEVNDIKTQCVAIREAALSVWQIGQYREAQLKNSGDAAPGSNTRAFLSRSTGHPGRASL